MNITCVKISFEMKKHIIGAVILLKNFKINTVELVFGAIK